jgi:hypothetical protein
MIHLYNPVQVVLQSLFDALTQGEAFAWAEDASSAKTNVYYSINDGDDIYTAAIRVHRWADHIKHAVDFLNWSSHGEIVV